MTAIWTIGHSTRTEAVFLELLDAHGIRAVADVRLFPASRRYPHFNRDAMQTWLAAGGVAYRHYADLGGRRKPHPESRNTGLRHPQFRGYADHMATPGFDRAIRDLIEWSAQQPAAVMCAEAVYWQCHRSLLSDALAARGLAVAHILDAGKSRPHRIHELARIDGSTVCYPGLL